MTERKEGRWPPISIGGMEVSELFLVFLRAAVLLYWEGGRVRWDKANGCCRAHSLLLKKLRCSNAGVVGAGRPAKQMLTRPWSGAERDPDPGRALSERRQFSPEPSYLVRSARCTL